MSKRYVIGLDFGTDSVRAVLVDTDNGSTLASRVSWYKRWKNKKFCDPECNRFRQHPLDHIEGTENTIKGVLEDSGIDASLVKGICIDTTGSSPLPVTKSGEALALQPGFEENPNAMMVLWKDHTAIKEAEEMNKLAGEWNGPDYMQYVGGIYSSEWFWAKILHISREDEQVKNAAYSWMEHCDYMTYLLVGEDNLEQFRRSRCAAGHKALWHESWGGLPEDAFFEALDPYLVSVKKNLYKDTYTSDLPAGNLNSEWAERLGLSTDCIVAVGTFDAHAGAVGAEVKENTLVRVMGTSTCDIIVSSSDIIGKNTVKGICGQVDGSVIPGMVGLEAGQSAFGDLLAWYVDLLSWPLNRLPDTDLPITVEQVELFKDRMIADLSEAAEKTPLSENAPLALDWVNGRRTPDANQALRGAIMNLSLGTKAPLIFRALVEAICYGAKEIINRFEEEGVQIKSVVGIGGVAKKSAFIMQTLADVLDRPIQIAVSEQAPALGAAMYAAVASGIYPSVSIASEKMGNGFDRIYLPVKEHVVHYKKQFKKYQSFGAYIEKSTIEK
ncbi:ribulokinase [Marivirga lumbricoides]|uniref:Ribulokinase n=1 Tax=Marivirga lumbricoides TaxID=1046115 RepID=A0ABQ1M0B0_9BACT|nr:ribulokinase [Marivirga lumbricoides]